MRLSQAVALLLDCLPKPTDTPFVKCLRTASKSVRIHVYQHNPSPLPFPQWRLEEQRPLGLVGQRGGEMLEANGEEGSAVTQMSLWQ